MPPKKSIYRQPGAQHFQLVHRSVRDPLANDPEASQHVFKSIERGNDKAGHTLSELEESLDKKDMRDNEGEAATYGITYDDSDYDYMQHLRRVGEGGLDSVLLAAPRGSGVAPGMKSMRKGKARAEDMFEMPEEVLPSQHERSVADVYASQEAIPQELQGLQPDMDPHLRQVLEALDDDAFVDDDNEGDDVFGELLGSGEVEDGEEPEEFEFAEWGVGEDGDDDDARTENGEPREETWEDRFRAFKAAGGKPQQRPTSNGGWDSDEARSAGDAERSEMADTIGSLVSGVDDLMVRGGKKRHGKRGPSDASGMSMSSSNVYRNDNLRMLDQRFDRLERLYEMDDEEDDEWVDDDNVSMAPSAMSSMSRVSYLRGDEPTGAGPAPEVSRDDFDRIMDDFLDNYEVVGRRMHESLGATTMSGPDKLKVLRSALEDGEEGPSKEENRRRILELEERLAAGAKDETVAIDRRKVEPAKDKWDVETILSTYTNTENHPGMIRVRNSAEAQERAQRRAEARLAAQAAAERQAEEDEDEDDSGSETERETEREPKVTVARPKGESAEDRKARKAAVKAERASRRAEKKSHKETFGGERKRQLASQRKMVAGGKAADVAVGSRGVVSLS